MKKTNFLKGLALAAVVLVGGFATSCSEEELSIKGGQTEITLPDASASVSISVVDLEKGKLVGSITTIDATSAIGSTMTVECPANAGYTTAAAIEVTIPALKKGQSVNVPVTFYVVTLESALAEWMNGKYYTYKTVGEPIETELSATAFIDANGWVKGVYTNDTDEDLTWENGTSPLFNFWRESGWEYVSEIEEEEEEETEVLAVSRAAETTVIDLLKSNKFKTTRSGVTFGKIKAFSIYTVKKITQYYYNGVMTWYDSYTGEEVMKYNAKQAGTCWFDTVEQEIELGHDGHDAPTHDGHDGHGHGGNSNAGGGIGGDDAGE